MPLPAFVRQDDGRLEPFDPDRLYRRLFAAAESAGYADPLAARELTDLALHFLADGCVGLIVDLEEVRLRVETALRELRHEPALAALAAAAESAAEGPPGWAFPPTAPLTPSEAADPRFRTYGRALALAQELGLLRLDACGDADGLAALVCRLPEPGTPGLEFIEGLRAYVSKRVIFDAPDLDGVLQGWSPEGLTAFLAEAAWASAIHDLTVECHLNAKGDPPWGGLAAGPLFRGQVDPLDQTRRNALWAAITKTAMESRQRLWSGLKFVWHSTAPRQSTEMCNRGVSEGSASLPLDFFCDPENGPVGFGAGLTRRSPALLMAIDVSLGTLRARQREPLAAEQLIGKAQSLVRLAAAAGSRKRERLRRNLPPEAGWFVEASHVHLRLVGVAAFAADMPDAVPLRRELERRFRRTLKEESQLRSLLFTGELAEEPLGCREPSRC